MDIKSAFLHAPLDKELFIKAPLGYNTPFPYFKLNKALYSLKQAPKSWYDTLKSWLLKENFTSSSADPCLYINAATNVHVFVYVDDLLIVGNSVEFRNLLKAQFKISQDGPLSKILGNQLVNTKDGLGLLQSNHIDTALSELGLINCKPISTPLTPNIKLLSATDDKHQDFLKLNINYQLSTGYLNFIASQTRPNLAYAISNLSQFNNKPGMPHWTESKHAWRYLSTSKDLALHLQNSSFEYDIEAFRNSDGGNNPESRRSHTGYLILLYGCPVSWHSKLQPTISLSSTKGELKALVLATQENLWLSQLITKINPN